MSQTSIDLEGAVRFLNKHWFEKEGVIAVLIFVIFAEVYLLAYLKVSLGESAIWILGTIGVVVGIWKYSRRPPKTPKNKIGFMVSISCSDDKESEKIREDFIIPLRKLVKAGVAGKFFHFMELPQHLSKEIIEPDDAQVLRVQCNAHYILFGRVRLRDIEGQRHHFIEMDGLVSHNPIPEQVQKNLAQEFSQLLPRKLRISTKNDIFSFQFTSEWTDIVSRYIIGLAFAYSGDIDHAEKLYADVEIRLVGKDVKFPAYGQLSKRIKTRILEIKEVRAAVSYEKWIETHDNCHLEDLGQYLGQLEMDFSKKPLVVNLKAIFAFLNDRDTERSISLLKSMEAQNYSEWHYNLAFLFGYQGELKSSIRQYREGLQCKVDVDTIFQVDEFLSFIIKKEPEKYQLLFCAGFFCWKIKSDRDQALKNFRRFLNQCEKEKYEKECDLAEKWIAEITEKVGGGIPGGKEKAWTK